MPKESRRRSAGGHEPSAKLSKRKFAVQENAVDHIDVVQTDASGTEILQSMAEEELEQETRPMLKKKEKLAVKHELFVRKLQATRSPYSKSHDRRMKRKAREQIANGLTDMQSAISAVELDIPAAVQTSVGPVPTEVPASNARIVRTTRPGQIGEGKSAPLSKAQRKRALMTEKMRIPMILKTPEYSSNPFQTIRTHAQNTLLKHEKPSSE